MLIFKIFFFYLVKIFDFKISIFQISLPRFQLNHCNQHKWNVATDPDDVPRPINRLLTGRIKVFASLTTRASHRHAADASEPHVRGTTTTSTTRPAPTVQCGCFQCTEICMRPLYRPLPSQPSLYGRPVGPRFAPVCTRDGRSHGAQRVRSRTCASCGCREWVMNFYRLIHRRRRR